MADSKVVSFRLEERHHAMLAGRAETLGQSTGELARQLVLEGLLGAQVVAALEPPLAEALAELRAVHAAVQDARVDFEVGLKAILVTLGKIPPEQVDRWIEVNLGKPDA